MAFYFYIALALIAACDAEPASNAAAASSPSYVCKSKNGYYPIEGYCDSYIQCRDYRAATITCPDGLHFNPDAKWPYYPCGYPMDVPCEGRTAQVARSTADCPHRYGYFPSPAATPEDCGHFRLCVEGQAYNMECTRGLAFNPATSRCDWPDLVPSCKASDFLGFTCPPAPVDEYGEVLDTVINYKYHGGCFSFISCQFGRARLLSCDDGFAFDSASGRCVDEDLVACEHQILQ